MMSFFKQKPWLLSVLGGLLMAASWPPLPLVFLIIPGLLCFLYLFQLAQDEKWPVNKSFLHFFIGFLVWNVLSTYWVCFASVGGGIAAILANSVLMCLPFLAALFTARYFKAKLIFPTLVFYWLSFEYLHLNWELTWPWLTLGNVFANTPFLVQWYSYTGHLGGTLWIFTISIFLFRYLLNKEKYLLFRFLFWLIVPSVLSLSLWFNSSIHKGTSLDVVIIQPNIDPYSEKFGSLTGMDQLDKMLKLAEQKVDSNTDLLLLPETSLVGGLQEDIIENSELIRAIRQWMQKYPKLKILAGADTYIFYPNEGATVTARKSKGGDYYYDVFNSALFIENAKPIQIYHKSKLVPGVERMPYPGIFGFLEKWAINMGGTSGSLGVQEDSEVFVDDQGRSFAPVICYESVFGDYLSSYIRKGAGLICVITNDGWWGNTPGYRQHLAYAKLRAIESNRFVVRSANTGISGMIDEQGRSYDLTNYWEEAVIKVQVPLNSEKTFYTQAGDYIGKMASMIAALIFVSTLVRKRTYKGY